MAKALLPMRVSIVAIAFRYESSDGTKPVGDAAGAGVGGSEGVVGIEGVVGTEGVAGTDGADCGDVRGVHLGEAGFDLGAGFNRNTGFRKGVVEVFVLAGVTAEPAEPASAVVVLAAPGVSGKDAGVAAGGGASVG